MIPAAKESPSTLIIVRKRSLRKEKATIDKTDKTLQSRMHVYTYIYTQVTVFCIKNKITIENAVIGK